MASIDDISGNGAGPGASPVPPPEWVPAQHPWATAPEGSIPAALNGPAGATQYPSSPPLADAPGGPPPWGGWPPAASPPPPPPPPWSPPPAARPNGPRRFLLAVVAALAIGGLLGAGLANVVHLHGARPTLSGSAAPTTAAPALPTVPGGQINPSPSTPGNGNRGTTSSAAIAAKVNPSIVDVNTVSSYQGSSGAGTGMVLTSTGDILTNNHVVDGATSIKVTFVTTGRSYHAEVVGTAPSEDVAVIRVTGVSGLQPISIADSSAVRTGDPVVAIGNAGGTGGTPTVVTGTVLSLNQTITASDNSGANAETLHGLIRTDAPIQPGDSGGALVDSSAKVVGINTAASANRSLSTGTSEGFAIPITKAVSVARQIEGGKASSTVHIGVPGFLGVSIDPSQASGSAGGAAVSEVENATPAESAGIQAGDTITAVGGQTVSSPDSLSTITKSHRGGDRVVVKWTSQDGTTHSATVTLIDGPAD